MRFNVLKVLIIVMGMGLHHRPFVNTAMPKSQKPAQMVSLVRLMLSSRFLFRWGGIDLKWDIFEENNERDINYEYSKTLAGALVGAMAVAPFAANAQNKPVDITFGGKVRRRLSIRVKLSPFSVSKTMATTLTLPSRDLSSCPLLYSADQSCPRSRDDWWERNDRLPRANVGRWRFNFGDWFTHPNWVDVANSGAINLPWTKPNTAKGADPLSIGEIMEGQFNATQFDGLWKFGRRSLGDVL